MHVAVLREARERALREVLEAPDGREGAHLPRHADCVIHPRAAEAGRWKTDAKLQHGGWLQARFRLFMLSVLRWRIPDAI